MRTPTRPSTDYVWPHLSSLPAFRAIIRSIEHRIVSDYVPLRAPVLDLGAGDGHFTAAVLPGAEIGIDLNPISLREARRRAAHRLLICASATEIPLGSGTINAAIANCVVEHIPDLETTLSELNRVLAPGGTLLLTVPTDRQNPNLLLPTVLSALRLDAIGGRYMSWFRRVQVHHHMYSRKKWIATVEAAGFSVVRHRGYMSARATRFFEMGHYFGIHNLLARKLLGRWVVWPWRPRFYLIERLLASFVDEPEHEDDSCLFMEARKL